MKCVPVLENRYNSIRLTKSQSEKQNQLTKLLIQYQQEEKASMLTRGHAAERFADVLELLPSSQGYSDFWLRTSGYLFNQQRALALKQAGLIGIALRLDHFEPDKHNSLRGYKHSYGWVLKAADIARSSNLILCLRLSPSPGFITPDNLFTYTRLAKKLGATFIQLVEPGTSHELMISSDSLAFDEIMVIDDFTEMINYEKDFINWPVISYRLARQQKTDKSPQDAKHSLFVDATGKIHSTTF